jgi:hypothetical protein
LTVNLELAIAAVQVAEAGTMTAQTLGAAEVSKAMPAPCSVMMIPAWIPAVMAPVGVNEKVAVVDVALTADASVIARPLMPEMPTPIPPEAAPADATVSESVCTVMPVALSATAAAPIVKPDRVMMKCVFAKMPALAVVMTMELPVMIDVAVMVATDAVPAALGEGFGVAAKNPAG